MTRQVRVCVVGDELCAAVGDPRALGWVGRVWARSRLADGVCMPLAVPGETTSELSARWESECAPRFGPEEECDNRLVVAIGRNDIVREVGLSRSRLNLANILDRADYARIKAFVVGPPPGWSQDGDRIAELSAALADVAQRRNVPYVDTYTPLATHEQWLADLAQSGTLDPGQAGYGLIAWLVLHTGWHGWLGLEPEE